MFKPGDRNYKWVVLALLFVAYFIVQAARQLYYASIPPIRENLGLGATALGMVATTFLLVYGLCAPCASVVADILRRKTVVVCGCFVFSAGILAAGFAPSIAALVACYGVVAALGQSMVPSSSSAIVSEFHEKTRSTALSIYQSALYLGVILSSVFAGRIGSLGPGAWRRGFWILGAFGVIWSVVLLFFLHERAKAVPEETRAASASAGRASAKEAVLSVLGSPSALLLTLGFGLCQYGDNGFRVWMATHLGDTFLPDARTAAAFHAVFWFYVGAFLGINVAGRLTDRMITRSPTARFEVAAAGLALSAPCALFAVRTGSLAWACAGLFCWGFARGIYDSNFFASLYDVVPARFRAAATGLFCCGGFVLGSAAPAVLGKIAETFSMMTGLSTLGIFYLLGAVAVMLARQCGLKIMRKAAEQR